LNEPPKFRRSGKTGSSARPGQIQPKSQNPLPIDHGSIEKIIENGKREPYLLIPNGPPEFLRKKGKP
jgi:hypothetical protein